MKEGLGSPTPPTFIYPVSPNPTGGLFPVTHGHAYRCTPPPLPPHVADTVGLFPVTQDGWALLWSPPHPFPPSDTWAFCPLYPAPPLQVAATVGLFPVTQDASRTWVSTSLEGKGIAMRVCSYLPPEMLVRSRCGDISLTGYEVLWAGG